MTRHINLDCGLEIVVREYGTLSIYEPSTGNFAALGHGITDIDTGNLVEISNGDFLKTNIVSIDKGQKGNPR